MSKIATLIVLFQKQPFPLQYRLSKTLYPVERYFSTNSDGSDDGTSKDKNKHIKKETQNLMKDSKTKPEKQVLSKEETKEAAKKKLFSLLSEMKIDTNTKTKAGENLKLARPLKRVPKQERFKKEIQKHQEMQKSPEDKLQDAAKVVASSVKGDSQQTFAELNEKLRKLNLSSQPQPGSKAEKKILDEDTNIKFMSSVKEIADTVSDGSVSKSKLTERLLKDSTENKSTGSKAPHDEVVKGREIENRAVHDGKRREFVTKNVYKREPRPSFEAVKGMKNEKRALQDGRRREFGSEDVYKREPRPSIEDVNRTFQDGKRQDFGTKNVYKREPRPFEHARNMKIEKRALQDGKTQEFGSEDAYKREPRSSMIPKQRINIFDAAPLNIFKVPEEPIIDSKKTVWQALEEKSLQLLTQFAPANGFEEMIMWTEQGKHWKFPIDNQTELAGEENVGFHEHVFLEQHLHGFPTKGPIRHFMELVVVGLSKNPYVSVERKIENIDWFREYFKEKEDILKVTGALG